jgi:enoyl-CoA hydratase/carnithine racemase
MLEITDHDRVRTITLNRPEALNAFNEALYDATCLALRDAASNSEIAVVIVTGTGRAFSAGTDLNEMEARIRDPDFRPGAYGFAGLLSALAEFPKPLICAVNGLGIGIGTTILGYADLAFMSKTARLKCPFTSLGVAPEAASSYLLPALVGRQNAAWMLMSSEWINAEQALAMGLVFGICEPDELISEATQRAEVIAQHPIQSLVAVKRTLTAPYVGGIADARAREDACFVDLMGTEANTNALSGFTDRRRNQESQ